ncbi:MAG: heparinase II/III family protein [Tannerella sp.]|jgi:hypothetical protein|nr:heparinase II/III family protein [Tannerella sp.]
MQRLIIFILLSVCFITNASERAHSPHLYFTTDNLEALKKRIEREPQVKQQHLQLIEQTNKSLNDNRSINAQNLCFCYLMTNDSKYSDRIKEILNETCGKDKWVAEDFLRRDPPWNSEMSTASTASSVGLYYDCIKNTLSASERKYFTEKLVKLGIEPVLGDWLLSDKRIHSLNSMGHNWWAHIVYNVGIAVLAIIDDEPRAQEWIDAITDAAPLWFSFGGDELQNKHATYDRGFMYESVSYSTLGNTCYLNYLLAWENTFKGKKMPAIEYLSLLTEWYLNACYPRTGGLYSLNFGDSGLQNNGVGVLKALCRVGLQSPDALWYLRAAASDRFISALDLVYPIDYSVAPKSPSIPCSTVYETNGWGMLRNSWDENATFLGVKCGYTWNHSHADCNSYILFHKGELMIKDAGNTSYGNKLYPEYFFQSQAHNVVLFDGKGQPVEQQYHGSPLNGKLNELIDIGSIRYLLANGTGPMASLLSRNFRHFLWIDDVILIIDDLKAHEYGSFEWLLHPEGKARKVGYDIQITNKSASVSVRPLFPEQLIATGYNHDFPEKMNLVEHQAPISHDEKNSETYYSICAPGKARQMKGITAIILSDSADLPVIERLREYNLTGVRIRKDRRVTDLYLNEEADGRLMHLNSCVTFQGFETDAYLTAFSYPEGQQPSLSNIDRIFIAYGSYLRKDSRSLFESLSKAFAAFDFTQTRPHMVVQGQERMNAEVYSSKKHGLVVFNGQTVKPDYKGNNLTLKVKK